MTVKIGINGFGRIGRNYLRAALAQGADLGISLDGDADRVMIIDEKGVVADGDQFMALIADRWVREGRLAKGTLVAMAQRPVSHVINYGRPPADGDLIVPNGTGVVLGTTATPAAAPDDTAVPDGEPERLLDQAIRMVPVLREIATVRSWAAVRPLAADDRHQIRAAQGAQRLLVVHTSLYAPSPANSPTQF